MRSVASAALVLAMVSVVSSVKKTEITDFSSEKLAVNESEVWAAAAAEISKQLENEMYKLCVSNAVSVDDISVTVITDGANFEVKRVDITGSGAQRAKNLIAGYFKIGTAYINSNGAG